MISVMIFNIMTATNGAPAGSNQGLLLGFNNQFINQMAEEDLRSEDSQKKLEDREMAMDQNQATKDMINNLNSLKSMVGPMETTSETLKNLGSKVFVNPNTAIIGDRKAVAPISPRDHNDGSIDRFSSYMQPHLDRHDSGFSMNYSHAADHTPRSNEGFEAFLDLQRSNSIQDTLGKRNDVPSQGFDSDLPYHDSQQGAKRRPPEMMNDQMLQSPTANMGRNNQKSGQESPANSYTGGFKLHSSRKNSDLQDLGPDFKPPLNKKTGEEVLRGKT